MIERILILLLERWQDRDSARMFGAKRSPKWRQLRRKHIRKHPKCAVTGSTKNCQVHHILPVWLYPEYELDFNNLITLRRDVHLLLGHLGSYRSYNPIIKYDARELRNKIRNRLP